MAGKNKHFLTQPLSIGMLILFGFAFLITLFVTITSYQFSLTLCQDSACLQSFFEHFKQPIWLSSGLITVLILLNLFYRTQLTEEMLKKSEESLESTLQQNCFSNYFEHLSQFEKYIEDTENLSKYLTKPRASHEYFYPNAIDGDFRFNVGVIEKLNKVFIKFSSVLNQGGGELTGSHHHKILNLMIELGHLVQLRQLCDDLFITYNPKPCELDLIRHNNDPITAELYLPAIKYSEAIYYYISFFTGYLSRLLSFYPVGLDREFIKNPFGIDLKKLDKEITLGRLEEYKEERDIAIKLRQDSIRNKYNYIGGTETTTELSKTGSDEIYKFSYSDLKLDL
ncbi:hypothetical protein [Thalassotalea atypica]|uniref:hypothetical protein n=1 Tax=Thalassotalea atypica TaxID=2054316 RepID=UPI0025735E8B|nr:hypothetical protein [Thalassotalea atypica]